MKRNFFNYTKMLAMGLTIAASAMSCNNDDNDTNAGGNGQTTVAENFNVIYRVGHDRDSDWAILPLNDAQMKSGAITFNNNGFVLPKTRTQQMYATNNGKNVFVYDASNKKVTKYETTGDKSFYKEKDVLDVTPILGNAGGTWKVMDDKTALVFGVYEDHQKDNKNNYTKTVVTLQIGKIDLETFNANVKDVKTYILENDTDKDNTTVKNLHINSIGHPIVNNGKIYFGLSKRGYDDTTAKNVNYANYDISPWC